MTDRLQELSDLGVSIWLDDLDRSRLTTGGLARMISEDHVVGVTTNPSIFSKAISTGAAAYAAQVASLASGQGDRELAVREMTSQDVRDACDVFSDVAARSDGVDGRVSIEVDPRLARDTDATIEQAPRTVVGGRPPQLAHQDPRDGRRVAGHHASDLRGDQCQRHVDLQCGALQAGHRCLGQWSGAPAERRQAGGRHPLRGLVLRQPRGHRGGRSARQAHLHRCSRSARASGACANARLAWQAYQMFHQTTRWKNLSAAGAHPQRPLWASTGVKDPAYPDDMYVVGLAGPGCQHHARADTAGRSRPWRSPR